jgi:PAS domain S-box-containing protein
VSDRFERQLEVASLSGETEAVMAGIVDRLLELEGADGASLSTIEEGRAHFKVSRGADAELADTSVPVDETLGWDLVQRREVAVLRADPDGEIEACQTRGAKAIILAPIAYDGTVRGILGVRSGDEQSFDAQDVEAVRLLARGASIALRNAETIERLGESERGYRALHAEAADAILVGDLEGNLIDANEAAAALLWYSLDELRAMNVSGLTDPARAAASQFDGEKLTKLGELRGELCFVRKDGARVDVEYSSRLLEDGRVHTTLRDVGQRKRNEERLRSSLGRLHAIIETQQEIAALELDPDAVTSAIVARAQRLAGADGAAVQWFEGDSCTIQQASGITAPHVGVKQPRSASLAGLVALTGETAHSSDTTDDPRVDAVACRQVGARSLICAPLYRDGQIAGVLSVMGRDPEVFDDLDVETTRVMAEFVSTVIRNAYELDERRRLVDSLRESEARFRGAFDFSSLGMALTALDGSFVQVNDRFAELLDYTVDELKARGVQGITHPDDFPADRERLRQLQEGEITSFQREKRYLRRDGSILWAHLTVSLIAGSDAAPAYVVSHIQDVTAQKESSLLYEATFERSVVPKIVVDDSRRLVDLNQAAAELIGTTHDEALTLTIDDLFVDEDVARRWKWFLERGEMQAEATLCRPDGGRRLIEFVSTANVRPGRHIAVIRDLTRQKELEAQLSQAQKMEAVGRLAGGIAHDFNNLLTAISGYSEFLIAGQTDDRLRRHAEEIRKASARAAALTGQLLAFSRRQVLQPRVLDLNAVVSDMDMMLRRLIGEDVELVTMHDPGVGTVQADPTQLEQVIVNLAVNAREAMPNGGSVTIETANVETHDGEFVELRLTDTGLGMTEEARKQLFDPFFTTKEGGTGLGLATVYGIVEQSGGTIEVESAPGLGSSFRILFPRAEAPMDEPAVPVDGATLVAGSETVLLVEDEAVVRHLVAEILESKGYVVLQASDGPSALELLRRHTGSVDLLVTDVVMPAMSGPEVAQAVTSMRPGTQVLYTSGYTDSQIGHHGVLEPGIAFLQKPFSADDLAHKVRALLDETAVAVD